MPNLESFVHFLARVRATNHAQHLQALVNRMETVAPDANRYDEMRDHILSLYDGVQAVHSFIAPDGSIVDCIPVDKQPGVRDLPSGEKLSSTPASLSPPAQAQSAPNVAAIATNLAPGAYDQDGNEQCCPVGSIPMRRITVEEISRFGSLQKFLQKKGRVQPLSGGVLAPDADTHRYAHAYQNIVNHGGSSRLNVWDPVPATNEFALSQHWYVGGAGNELQTLEGGWQVYPEKYGTQRPVLFIYWTADFYQTTGNYNLDKPAFVKTNGSWLLGGALPQVSARNGGQHELHLQWQRDATTGNWWLSLQFDNGPFVTVGYYPPSLYRNGQMTRYATGIDYGGEVTGTQSGQMGSGAFASAGANRAAYQRQIEYFDTSNSPITAILTPDAETPAMYTIDLHNNATNGWGTYFYFGGPGSAGHTWGRGQTINNADSTPHALAAAVFNGKIYTTWKANDPSNRIFISGTDNPLGVWPNGNPINHADSTPEALALATFSGKLYAAWKANDPSNRIFISGTDNPLAIWPNGQRINGTDSTPQALALAVFNGKLYAAWKANDPSNRIFISGTENPLGVWPNGQTINQADSTPQAVALAAFNGKLYAAWKANDPSNRIFISGTDHPLGVWPNGHVINVADSTPLAVALLEFNGNLYLLWKSNDPSNGIFFSMTNDPLGIWPNGARINSFDTTPQSPVLRGFVDTVYSLWKANDPSNRIFVSPQLA